MQKGYGEILIRTETKTSIFVFKVDTFYPISFPVGAPKQKGAGNWSSLIQARRGFQSIPRIGDLFFASSLSLRERVPRSGG